jgi:hypothetical protein
MVVKKYLTVLSGKYPANLYRMSKFYRISDTGSGTSLVSVPHANTAQSITNQHTYVSMLALV